MRMIESPYYKNDNFQTNSCISSQLNYLKSSIAYLQQQIASLQQNKAQVTREYNEELSGIKDSNNKEFSFAYIPLTNKYTIKFNGIPLSSIEYSVFGKTLLLTNITPDAGDSLSADYEH